MCEYSEISPAESELTMGRASSSPDNQPAAMWRRASASIPDGYCVEVMLGPDVVGLRDSKGSQDHRLEFNRRNWATFLGHLGHKT